jgi:hypothetical protein
VEIEQQVGKAHRMTHESATYLRHPAESVSVFLLAGLSRRHLLRAAAGAAFGLGPLGADNSLLLRAATSAAFGLGLLSS